MSRIKVLLLFIPLLFLPGCPDPKGTADSRVMTGSGTVYGSEPVADREDMEVTDLAVADDPVPYETSRLNGDYDNADTLESSNLYLDWEPVYFEFDKATLSDGARTVLKGYAETLMRNMNVVVLLEGHCDSRGTEEYNMALGERRARQVGRYLEELGVAPSRLKTISYGELRPAEMGENERAWARNRRVSFIF